MSARAHAGHDLQEVKDEVQNELENAKGKIREGLHNVNEKAHEIWDKAADTSLHDMEKSVVNYVKKNPGRSLLAAAGVGLLLGIYLRSR